MLIAVTDRRAHCNTPLPCMTVCVCSVSGSSDRGMKMSMCQLMKMMRQTDRLTCSLQYSAPLHDCVCVQCEWFFSSWDEDVYVPVDEEGDEATPISGINPEIIARAETLGMHISQLATFTLVGVQNVAISISVSGSTSASVCPCISETT